MPLELYCKQNGTPVSPALIFIHGLFGNHRNLRAIAKPFESDHYVLQLDMRNHGQSPHDPVINYDVMSDDLALFIDQNKIMDAVLVGHSMGGKVAMLHALKYPATVRAIFILDIAPVTYDFEYVPVIENLLSIDLTRIASRDEADQQLSEHYKNESFRQFLLQNLIRKNNQFHWRLNLPALKDNIQSICQFPGEPYPAFTRPTCFLAGAESDYVKANHRDAMRLFFPNHSLEYLEQAGHWLHGEHPETVSARLRTFLCSLATSKAF